MQGQVSRWALPVQPGAWGWVPEDTRRQEGSAAAQQRELVMGPDIPTGVMGALWDQAGLRH